MSNKHSRNEPCQCGSGKKYKKCCGFKEQKQKQTQMQLFRGMTQFQGQAAIKTLTDRVIKVMPHIAQDIGKAISLLSTAQKEQKAEEEKPENAL